ncbi:MAG: GAF domain-containing protein [Desulfobacteraceae bacterium]|nr:MAG: GAF domain-containing protein [Desulfobacteraceae bacterium]
MESRVIDFPFKCVLSIKPLIALWDQILSEGDSVKAAVARTIREELKNAPALLEPIEDFSTLEKHQELLDMLMSIVFPPAFWEKDCAAAFVPFHFKSVYATPTFKRLLMQDCQDLEDRANIDTERWEWGRLLKAYLHILRTFYDVDLVLEYPLVVKATDPDTGLDRHLNIMMDPKFVEVKKIGKLQPLSKSAKKRLIANAADLKVWIDLVPPENFEFHGFGLFRAVDVTDQEVLSSLKRDLIEKESIFSQEGFELLQEKLRTFLRKPGLQLGLAALQGEQVLILGPQHKHEKGCIFEDSVHCKKSEYEGSVFAKALEKGEPIVIEDLQTHPSRTSLEEHMIQSGVRSIFVTALHYQDKLLGTFDLKSPHPGELNVLNTMKVLEILPLFSMALNRGMEELNHRVQAIIKEKCTAIHPSVEWRFQRAALNYMESQDETPSGLEPIVFPNVFPLYGASDIRGSSEHRNAAIQSDLIDHLKITREIIQLANRHRTLPILDALVYRIDKNIREIETGLSSGDEVAKLDFIRHVIEPVFDHIRGFNPEVREKIEAYRAALDTNMGNLYRNRKDFEESITLINETITSYLDKEEETAQGFFPHYFEKLKTDGVDHTIYIGASMIEDGEFDLLYLRNLRLWQLMVMCGVVWRTGQLKGTLKVPLETTHLILVQNTPLSIRFRPDERRFDVDGAYDIRHEIIKKRIDKAMIKGRSERLTQPEKIAIVYSHRREALEYREYIDYLQASGYFKDEIENLELQDFQGVHGLKALRVAVDNQASLMEEQVSPEVVKEAVRAMPQVAA